MSIKPLLLARRKADPAFQYAKDPKTGQYYLQNRVVFMFAPQASEAEMTESIEYYVYATNEVLAKKGNERRVVLDSIKFNDRGVIVIGSNINLLAKGGGFTPPVGPPPPIITPLDITYDRIVMVVAFQNDFSTFHTVLPESQILF